MRSSRTEDPAQDFPLGFGLQFAQLYEREGLVELDRAFIAHLQAREPALASSLIKARAQPNALDRPGQAELLLALGPELEGFIGELFGIEAQLADLRRQSLDAEAILRVKWKFVRRKAALGIPAAEAQTIDGIALAQGLVQRMRTMGLPTRDWSWLDGGAPKPPGSTVLDTEGDGNLMGADGIEPGDRNPISADGIEQFEADFAAAVTRWQASTTHADQEALELARRYAAWAVHTEAGQQRHLRGQLFRLPLPRLPAPGIAHVEGVAAHGTTRWQVMARHAQPRDGFALADDGGTPLAALAEASYCLHCHPQGKDSCARGLSASASGCPLEQRISEFLAARARGLPLTALALITIENPMCAATGHRICNDCSNACIFQQQTPVDIPRAETRTLRDILALPWGFEVYSLLTRWNPLNLERPLPRPPSGRKVLVAGLGPAGFTLAHHLIQDGHAVFAIDGLKLEPLPAARASQGFGPVIDIGSLWESLEERMPRGFGGVAEYGITVRWDKNFLTLIRLLLERRSEFALAGSVRLGGTLTLDDAFNLGFDHVALATGAGAPTLIDIPNALASGVRTASDFLMTLQSGGALRRRSVANLQIRMPVVVIGGGLTAIDTATEAAAYYIRHVERFFERMLALEQRFGPGSLPGNDAEDEALAAEYRAHGEAIRAERAAACAEGRPPQFARLLEQWGGVTVVYRRTLSESPAARLNADELAHALAQGITVLECLAPEAIEVDTSGAACAIRFKPTHSGARAPVRLPARSIFIAAGTRANTVLASEPGNRPLCLQEEWFLATNELGEAVVPEASAKPAHARVLAGRREDGRFVSFFGDLHPSWSGSVVRAMASALRGHRVVTDVLLSRPPADARSFEALAEDCRRLLTAQVVRVVELAPSILEIVLHAPMAARQFQPGQFFRLQNFESLEPAGTGPEHALEPLALTGAWVDAEAGLVGTIVLQVGASSAQCSRLRPGSAVALMGPSGAPTTIPRGETVALVGGGLGNAVLFSIGAAMRAAGSHVVYFAAYRRLADRFHVSELEAAADQIVWCCEEAPGFTPSRPQDLSVHGNVLDGLEAYGAARLGRPTSLRAIDRLLAIGSDRMMAAVAQARHSRLKDLLPPHHLALGSVNSPMQCMLKGVCGQCLQRLQDPETGRSRWVFSCQNQDQALDAIDFAVLHQRLGQNRLEERQTLHWLDACVSGAGSQGATAYNKRPE